MPRLLLLSLALGISILLIMPTLFLLNSPVRDSPQPDVELFIQGAAIMPKLGNETAKAELGKSTWKLLHTMAQRYPENPKEDEQEAFKSFLHLLSRLYPCGECAAEFQLLLKENPPQTRNRNTASLWLCGIHNRVNTRLQKPQFDCSKLDGLYDCGCGPEENKETQHRKSDDEVFIHG